jgi:hypothetical protein
VLQDLPRVFGRPVMSYEAQEKDRRVFNRLRLKEVVFCSVINGQAAVANTPEGELP